MMRQQKETQQTQVKGTGVRPPDFYTFLTGRFTPTYNSPQVFAEEAMRLGVSRKVVGIVGKPGDILLACVAPHRLKRIKGNPQQFHPDIFGYSKIRGYGIHPKTPLARKVLNRVIDELIAIGAAIAQEIGQTVVRRCGYYTVGRQVILKDWEQFAKLLHARWEEELRTQPRGQRRRYTFTEFDFLVQGDFKPIDPPLSCPFPIVYSRVLRKVKPHELSLLMDALRVRLDEAAIDAILTDRTDQPAVLLELTEYVQQAMNKPKGTEQRRRRKVKEQPTHIPEPEAPKPLIESKPETLSATTEPEPSTHPEPHHPSSNCILCGKPTEGTVLCPQCKEAALKKLTAVKATT
jgi:hypothetical protein